MKAMHLHRYGLLLIVGLACVIRWIGVGYGPYHADEPIVVNHALQYATGDFNPHFFKIPPLVSYLCFVVYGGWFILGKVFGVFASAADFEMLFVHRPEVFYWVGRVAWGVLPGTVTVWAVGMLARRWLGERVAVWAAAAMAFNFLHARDSHAVYTDILMTLLVLVSVAAAVEFFRRPDSTRAFWAGIAVGAATAAKYNALLAGAAVLVAWILVSRKIRPAAMILIGTFVTFFVLNPFALLDAGTFLKEVAAQATAEGPVSLSHLIGYSLAESSGWGILIIAVAGCAAFFWSDRKLAAVIFAFPALFFVKLMLFSQPHERYVMPILPFVALAFGCGVVMVLEAFERKGRGKRLAACVMASTLLFGAVKIVTADALFLKPDTRDLARSWITDHLTTGARIAFTDTRLRPLLARNRQQWEEASDRIATNRKTRMEYEASSENTGYYLNFIEEKSLPPFGGVWPAVPASASELKRLGVRYVVAHYGTEGAPSWRQDLRSKARLIKRFSPYHDPSREFPSEKWSVTFAAYSWKELASRERFGPVLEVYEL